jgi:hypothetical protein
VAFAVIFLSALFLFMRNYPSDRWFSGVFIVAGGVLAWCAEAENKIECFYDEPVSATTDATNELDEHNGSNARQEQEGTEGRSERMGADEGK